MKINNWLIVLAIVAIVGFLTKPYIEKKLFKQDIVAAHSEDESEHEELIRLSEAQVEEIGLELSKVKQGSLANELSLTGEIKINEDKLAHIVAYSSGIVKQVNKSLGDYVQKGEILAVLDAPEISSLQEEYLEAVARLEIAEANYKREEQLLKENLTIESDYLTAKDELIRSKHDLHGNERKLKIFGFSHSEIANLSHNDQGNYNYYKIVAPYSGTIIEKEISTGEALEKNAEIFVMADLSTVWIDFSLYQKDSPFIRKDQEILIEIPNLNEKIKNTIAFVSPLLGENTRTAFARVVLANPNFALKPGTFVTGLIKTENKEASSLLIKKTAIQEINGSKVVFIQENGGFKAQEITLGESNENFIEVLSGLESEQVYVSENSFMLKAEMQKDEIDDDHDH
jgi:cobalt-zinc-cadmium efflux system membrane fusion protein